MAIGLDGKSREELYDALNRMAIDLNDYETHAMSLIELYHEYHEADYGDPVNWGDVVIWAIESIRGRPLQNGK